MVLFPTWSALILVLFGFHNPEDSVLHRSSTLKKFDTPHMRIFHTGEYQASARQLAIDGEAFLQGIENNWGIVLPDRAFTVSLIRVKPSGRWMNHDFDPPWLFSTYDEIQKRLELRANPARFEYQPTLKALKHHLIHALLNLEPAQPLPPFLEEGLARHYAGSRGSRQVYWAVLGFRYGAPVGPFLQNPYTYKIEIDYQYAGALGYHFIPWLWGQGPGVEKAFLQAHLQGRSVEQALAAAGLGELDTLLPAFEAQLSPEFGLWRLLKTYDFWLLFLSILAVMAMAFKIIAAFRNARMDFVEVVAKPQAVPAELFSGPAFQPAQAMTSPPEVLAPPVMPGTNLLRNQPPQSRESDLPTGDIVIPPMNPAFFQQTSVDHVPGLQMNTDEFDNLEDQLNEAFERFENTVEPPPQPFQAAKPEEKPSGKSKPIGEDTKAGIEDALEQFFEKLPQADSEQSSAGKTKKS